MSLFVGLYFIVGPAIVVISVIATFVYRRKRLKQDVNEPPYEFQRTDEIAIDPTTGIKQRVWYNPRTGERYYQNVTDGKK